MAPVSACLHLLSSRHAHRLANLTSSSSIHPSFQFPYFFIDCYHIYILYNLFTILYDSVSNQRVSTILYNRKCEQIYLINANKNHSHQGTFDRPVLIGLQTFALQMALGVVFLCGYCIDLRDWQFECGWANVLANQRFIVRPLNP